jgi:hypothetical protein
MADIAGIIEGASEGAGMGFRFLKHIERTKVLIHVVDVSGSEGRDPIEDFDKINAELAAYSESLLRKPMLVAANKIDLLPNDDDETLDRFTDYVESKGYKVFPLSAPISIGTEELLKAALEALARAEEEPDEEVEIFDFEKEDNDPDYRTIYVDEEDGLTLEVICCARNLSKGFVFADTRTDIRSFIRFSEVLDREAFFIEQHILQEQYREKILTLEAYDVSDKVEETRQLTLVDDCRDLCFIDDVLVYFVKEGLQAEGCWVRLLSVNESTISGILLHEPNQNFKCHKGDIIEFRLQETDENKIVCVKQF